MFCPALERELSGRRGIFVISSVGVDLDRSFSSSSNQENALGRPQGPEPPCHSKDEQADAEKGCPYRKTRGEACQVQYGQAPGRCDSQFCQKLRTLCN